MPFCRTATGYCGRGAATQSATSYGIWSRQATSSFLQERTPVMNPYSHNAQQEARGWYAGAPMEPSPSMSTPSSDQSSLFKASTISATNLFWMILRQQLVEGYGGRQPHLLSVHISKRHPIRSCTGVAPQFTPICDFSQTSETGSIQYAPAHMFRPNETEFASPAQLPSRQARGGVIFDQPRIAQHLPVRIIRPGQVVVSADPPEADERRQDKAN